MTYTELACGVIDKARDLTAEGVPFSKSLAVVLSNILWKIESSLPLYCSEDVNRFAMTTDEFKDEYTDLLHSFLNCSEN